MARRLSESALRGDLEHEDGEDMQDVKRQLRESGRLSDKEIAEVMMRMQQDPDLQVSDILGGDDDHGDDGQDEAARARQEKAIVKLWRQALRNKKKAAQTASMSTGLPEDRAGLEAEEPGGSYSWTGNQPGMEEKLRKLLTDLHANGTATTVAELASEAARQLGVAADRFQNFAKHVAKVCRELELADEAGGVRMSLSDERADSVFNEFASNSYAQGGKLTNRNEDLDDRRIKSALQEVRASPTEPATVGEYTSVVARKLKVPAEQFTAFAVRVFALGRKMGLFDQGRGVIARRSGSADLSLEPTGPGQTLTMARADAVLEELDRNSGGCYMG